MTESGTPKRIGRPRVPDEERKRHTLTFRMRSDLREAVEELAAVNGRTMSEQVEYYVDAAVFTEARLIYQYSTDAMSPALQRCIISRERKEDISDFEVSFPSDHREMLTIAGQPCLNTPRAREAPSVEPGGAEDRQDATRESAVDLLRSAAREGALEAIALLLSPSAGKDQAREQEAGAEHPISEGTLAKLTAELERLAASQDGGKQQSLPSRMPSTNALPLAVQKVLASEDLTHTAQVLRKNTAARIEKHKAEIADAESSQASAESLGRPLNDERLSRLRELVGSGNADFVAVLESKSGALMPDHVLISAMKDRLYSSTINRAHEESIVPSEIFGVKFKLPKLKPWKELSDEEKNTQQIFYGKHVSEFYDDVLRMVDERGIDAEHSAHKRERRA